MKASLWSLLVVWITVSVTNAAAQEYFGEFVGKLEGTFVPANPRPIFELKNDFSFNDPNGLSWPVPAKTSVDGASIPQIFWSIIGGPFEGAYLEASVIHDYYYLVRCRTSHDTHRNFYYGMRANGVSSWQAKAMYWAVDTFGDNWTVSQNSAKDCKIKYGGMPLKSLNLSDPIIKAVAVSKVVSIAKTLKFSKGEFLDYTESGPIAADEESIAEYARYFSEIIANEVYIKRPELIGVLSPVDENMVFEKLEAWSTEPNFKELQTNMEYPSNQLDPFVLNNRSLSVLQKYVPIRE